MFANILVCTDGSRLSDKAVATAIQLARPLGARLVAFHATQDYPYESDLAAYAVANGIVSIGTWRAAQARYARRLLDRVRARAEKAGVPCVTRYGDGLEVHAAILAEARKARCKLIVMASRGRHGLHKLLLGSQTGKVLALADVPVLVCR